MIILACGLSGSGKTTIIAHAARVSGLGLNHIKASDILRQEGRPITGLKASDVISNQELIVSWLLRYKSLNHGPILLDGHLLIETDDGPQLVPDRILAPLPLAGIIVVRSNRRSWQNVVKIFPHALVIGNPGSDVYREGSCSTPRTGPHCDILSNPRR